MNIRLANQRSSVLEQLRTTNGLHTLVDCGANQFIYDHTNFDNVVAIDVNCSSAVSDDVTFVCGQFEDHYCKWLTDNTCYTYIYFDVHGLPGVYRDVGAKREQYERIKQRLLAANLTNSFLVLWVRTYGTQRIEITDVGTR